MDLFLKVFAIIILVVIFLGMAGIGALFSLIAFSGPTSVNMVAAVTWGFKNDARHLVLLSGLFYLVFCLLVFGLFQKPYILLNMGLTHQGALRGYAESTQVAKLYDPKRQEYVEYSMNPPALAAERFDQAFDVVATYRLFPFTTPLDVRGQKLSRTILHLAAMALALVLLSVVQYQLARHYITAMQLPTELTPRLFLSWFGEYFKAPALPPPLATILVLVLISLFGGLLVRYIIHGYEKQFAETRNSFREQIMAAVRPGQEVHGRLVRRMFNYKQLHDEAVGVSFKSDQDYRRTIATTTYTFAFDGLVRQTPVYLCLTYEDFDDQMPMINALDRFFPPRLPAWQDLTFRDTRLMEPSEPKEFAFTVNGDYSIKLLLARQ